ncbi:MAG: CHAT domain-containing protein [Bacteroidales bacterium]|nr:CHAT domain-containing protein [Bacteroidales bacterium]
MPYNRFIFDGRLNFSSKRRLYLIFITVTLLLAVYHKTSFGAKNFKETYSEAISKGDSLLNYKEFNEARNNYEIAISNSWTESYHNYYINYKIGYSYLIEGEGFLALAYYTDILLSFTPQSKRDSAFSLLVTCEADILTIGVLSPQYNLARLLNNYAKLKASFSTWEKARFDFLLGSINYKRLDYNNAIRNFKKSLTYKHSDKWLEEWSWFYIGSAYHELLDYQNATDIFLFMQSTKLYHLPYHKVFNMLGKIYLLRNEYCRAINYFERSLNSASKSDYKVIAAETLINMGNCYMQKGKNKLAADMFDKAEKHSALKGTRHKDYIRSLISRGFYYGHCNNFDMQEKYLSKAMEFLEKTDDDIALRSQITGYLANAYIENHDYEQAVRAVETLLGRYENLRPAEIINSIGWTSYLSLLQQRARAAYYAWQADSSDTIKIARSYEYYKQSLDAVSGGFFSLESEQSKLGGLETIRNLYSEAFIAGNDLFRLTNNFALLDELFLLVENSKANIFKVNFHNSQALDYSNIPDSYVKLEGRLKKQLAWLRYNLDENNASNETSRNIPRLQKELAQAQIRYDSLINVFETEFPQYFSARVNPLKYNLRMVQQKISDDQVLIDYFLTNNRLFVFLVSKKNIGLKEVKIHKYFQTDILNYRDIIARPCFDDNLETSARNFSELSNSLYNILIAPFADKLEGMRLVIVPDRELNLIPFQTLVIETGPSVSCQYTEMPYLVKYHAVTTLYSAEQIFTASKKINNRSRLLGMSPTIDSLAIKYYGQLPGAEQEIQTIKKYFRGSFITGKEATKKGFLVNSPSYDILHLAMHTGINDTDPLYSKLYFSSDSANNDGSMFVYEIYEYPMRAKLLILSGCNTGFGELKFGEGIMNLARAFFYNGIENIITTQWAIADKSSASLMDYFYSSLTRGTTTDIALQEAKINFLKNEDPLRAHPYYWAGYVCVGNPATYKVLNTQLFVVTGVLILLFAFFITARNTRNGIF